MSDLVVAAWLVVTSVYTFSLFGVDKYRAGHHRKSRISEVHLLASSALGGWVGGLLGMILFRHKTAKSSFKFKFLLAFAIWAGLLWLIRFRQFQL